MADNMIQVLEGLDCAGCDQERRRDWRRRRRLDGLGEEPQGISGGAVALGLLGIALVVDAVRNKGR